MKYTIRKSHRIKKGGMYFENEDNGPMHIDELNVSPLSTNTDVESPQTDDDEIIEEIVVENNDNTVQPTNLLNQFNEVGDDNIGDEDDDNTTIATDTTGDSQLGGKKKKTKTKKTKTKKTKTKKTKTKKSKSKTKTKKTKKTKTKKTKTKKTKVVKMKGGEQQLYGRGYGANCYDPNFSIYNTNELKLFPYKPT